MTGSIWTEANRIHWPRPTKGFWFLGQAVDMIGRYVFPGEWRIEDMQAYRIVPRQKPAFVEGASGGRSLSPGSQPPPSLEDRIRAHEELCQRIDEQNATAIAHNTESAAALERKFHVQRIIGAAATQLGLKTFYRSLADLSDQPIPASYWATIWSAAVFTGGCVPASNWMREIDQSFDGDVFVLETQVRAIDWKKVELRVEPEPLGTPSEEHDDYIAGLNEEAPAPAPSAAVKLATKQSTETWYRDRVASAVASGIRYSRNEDETAGREHGIGRDRVRKLRREFAPAEWADGGRPAK